MAAVEAALFEPYWQRRETTREARERDTVSQIKACLRFCQRFLAAPTFRRDAWRRVDKGHAVPGWQGWPRFGEDRSAKESQPTSSRTAEKRCGVIARFVSFAQVRFRIVRKLCSLAVEKQSRSEFDEKMLKSEKTITRFWPSSRFDAYGRTYLSVTERTFLSIYESITLSNESPTRRLILSNVKTTEFRCLRWSLSS